MTKYALRAGYSQQLVQIRSIVLHKEPHFITHTFIFCSLQNFLTFQEQNNFEFLRLKNMVEFYNLLQNITKLYQ